MASGPVVGTWRLVSYQIKKADGQVQFPFGKDVDGYITYAEEGRMCVVLRLGTSFLPAKGFSFYAGTYELSGDQMVHRVAVASTPQPEGTALVRTLRIDGNTMSLSPSKTPPNVETEAGTPLC